MQGLIERIRVLEGAARPLEPDADQRAALIGPTLRYAERFLEALESAPAFQGDQRLARDIASVAFAEQGTDIERLLELLGRHVDGPGINPASGGHLGYIPGGGLFASALGDYLADVTNRYPGVYFANPGAVLLEHHLIAWSARLAGYPSDAAGTFCSGGSLANLTAMVAAREAHGLRAADYAAAVVYLTSQTHHSVRKALRIMGMGESVLREVPLDARYRMRADALDALIGADRAEGLRPWMVVASAGTTDVGAVDPMEAIGEVARRHRLWYHVDGAYGAFFALVDWARPLLRGMERSDSLVMDPHKTLFLPYGSGIALVRERAHLQRAFTVDAAYMQDALEHRQEPSPHELSPELTRPFRGLRMWIPLLVHGLAPFRAALEEKLLLARYFRTRVGGRGYETGPEPELSVVTYRYVPEAMREGRAPRDPAVLNRVNRAILEWLHRDGTVFVSSTMLNGLFTLRFACVVHRTHLATVDRYLGLLGRAAAELEPAIRVASP